MRPSLLVLAILGCLSLAAAAQPLPVSDHYFTTDGMKLHYAKLGKTGSPVILIQGSGGAARTWLENSVAQALATKGTDPKEYVEGSLAIHRRNDTARSAS